MRKQFVRSSNNLINYISSRVKKANYKAPGTRFYFMIDGEDGDRKQTFGVYDSRRKKYVLTSTVECTKENIEEMEKLINSSELF
jgi:hypothetical protein